MSIEETYWQAVVVSVVEQPVLLARAAELVVPEYPN